MKILLFFKSFSFLNIPFCFHNNSYFCLAPEEAIYEITACKPTENGPLEGLNGDVATIYVATKGIILNQAARIRAAELYKRDSRRVQEYNIHTYY